MRMLVVDDLEINRDLLVRRVRRLGHEAGVAINGRDALDQLERRRGTWCCWTSRCRRWTGTRPCRRIQGRPAARATPVVMVSAIDETDSVVRCLELGADDYLTKPFNPVMLKARMESSLAKKRLVDQQQLLLQALSREMEIGQRIQQGFLPAGLPVARLEPRGTCAGLRGSVGGDFYDAFMLPSGRLALVDCRRVRQGRRRGALHGPVSHLAARHGVPGAGRREPPAETLPRSVSSTNDYIATMHGRRACSPPCSSRCSTPAAGCCTT